MSENQYTPVINQYLDIKKNHQDSLLLFRLGDFYELYFEDAIVAAKILNIQLTNRKQIPMSGIPHHSLENYLPRLIKAGKSVSICEQVGEVKKKGIVERKVVRILTPGTATEEGIVDERVLHHLVVVIEEGSKYQLINYSTNNLNVILYGHLDKDRLIDEIEKLKPAEILLMEGQFLPPELDGYHTTYRQSWIFDVDRASRRAKSDKYLDTILKDSNFYSEINKSLAGLINYLDITQNIDGLPIRKVEFFDEKNYLVLKKSSIKNLEILENLRGSLEGSLLEFLEQTKTTMGLRTLQKNLLYPSVDHGELLYRQDFIEKLIGKNLDQIRLILAEIGDIENILSRIKYTTSKPRDLKKLSKALQDLPKLCDLLLATGEDISSAEILKHIYLVDKINKKIEDCIIDNPPNLIKSDSRVIKIGYDKELDELIEIANNFEEKIMDFEARERVRTGMEHLKVDYNNIQGFYIEISKAKKDKIPDNYIQRQTLKSVERYISSELQEFENDVLGSRTKAVEREKWLYQEFLHEICSDLSPLQEVFHRIAFIDFIASLAYVSRENSFVRPQMTDNVELRVIDGYHPIIKKKLGDKFISNSILLDEENNMLTITGPNMGGKSTYMRQTALIVILAHIGCFVPATSAVIGKFDAIYTRIGSSDDLVSGKSTFMVEMSEASVILNQATKYSLIVMDEIGRGTNTKEGLALSMSIAMYLAEQIGSRTLFATHFFEVTELAEVHKNIKNIFVSAKYYENHLYFLYKILEGTNHSSYGIEVAKMANLPISVITNAYSLVKHTEKIANKDAFLEYLKHIDIDTTTPKQALEHLYRLLEISHNE